MPSPVSTTPLVAANACTCASVNTCPPIVTVWMPSVAETVNVPVVVSLLPAAAEPLGLSPASNTVLSGPTADAVTTVAVSSLPFTVMSKVVERASPSPSVMV